MLRNIPPPGALKALLSKPGDPTRQERKLRKTTRSWRLPNLGMTYKIRNLFASIFVSFVFSAQFIIKILVSASWFEYGWYLAETNIISDILDRSIMIYTHGMGPAPKGMLKVFDHDHLQFGTPPLPQPLLSIHVNPGPHLFVAPRDEKSPHPKSVRETPNEATQQVRTWTKLGELPTVVPPSGASASMRALKTQETPECSGNQWLTRFSTWHIHTGKKLKTQSLRILFSLWAYSHSNLLEAISLTDRNMIAILIKPFIKSKLHQQCPASCLHHSRNFQKFNTVTFAYFPFFPWMETK